MRKSTHILILFSIVALLVLTPDTPLRAAPQLPSSFYGTVTVDGANAAAGTLVTAWINGVQYAQTATFTSNGSSVYTLDVPGDDPETPGLVEGGVTGNTIIFKVGGQTVPQTGTWQTGSNVALNLSRTTVAAINVSLPVELIVPLHGQATIPVSVASDVSTLSILAYQFTLTYDPNVIQIADVVKAATLSAGWTVSYNVTGGQVQIAAYGTSALTGSGPLLNLLFNTSNNGGATSNLTFASFKFNEGAPIAETRDGSVRVGSLGISGQVTYAPNSQPVSGAALSISGASAGSTTSAGNGGYTLAINVVGDYAVTPSKTGDLRDALSGLDAAYILQYVIGTRTFNAYQSAVADVSQADGVTAYDAALIARYLVNLQDPPSLTGQWVFSPASRSYETLNSDVTGQDFVATLFGDVTENWGAVVTQVRSAEDGGPTVYIPNVTGRPGETIRVAIQLMGAGTADIYAYELELSFDGTVVALQQVSHSERVGTDWQLVTNDTPSKVSLIGFGTTPLQTEGDIVYLDFKVSGKEGEETALMPERFRVNEKQPTSPREAAGKIAVVISGSNGNAIYLPFVNGTGAVERNADVTNESYIPLVNR